jgi:hypothetical protein
VENILFFIKTVVEARTFGETPFTFVARVNASYFFKSMTHCTTYHGACEIGGFVLGIDFNFNVVIVHSKPHDEKY